MKEINATEAHQVSHLRLGLTFDIRWHPLKVSLMFYGSQKVRMSLLPGGSWHCLTWKCRQREGAKIKIFMYNMYDVEIYLLTF